MATSQPSPDTHSISASASPIDVTQELIDFVVTNCKHEIRKNEVLYTLISDYFVKTTQMLEFFPRLEEFFSRSQVMSALEEPEKVQCEGILRGIKQHISRFREDAWNYGNVSNQESIRTSQRTLQEKIKTKREFLDKALESAEFGFTVFNALKITAYILCLCGSVLEVFLNNRKEVALAIIFVFPLVDIFLTWMRSHFNKKMERLRDEYNIIAPMHIACDAMIKHVEKINDMLMKIDALLNHVKDPDSREAENLIACAKELEKRYSDFSNTSQYLRKYSTKCTQDIKKARTVIWKQIINYPGTGQLTS